MARGMVTRRCGCTYKDPETGKRKQVGRSCPKLKADRRHGTWGYILPVTDPVTGKRKQLTKGGFATRAEAEAALDELRARVQKSGGGVEVSRYRLTVGEYLDEWIKAKEVEIKPKTLTLYRGHIRRYLSPYLGRVKLAELRPAHISSMFADMREKGKGEVTQQRVRAMLRTALGDAMREGLVTVNAASLVKMKNNTRMKRAEVWTEVAVERWKATGEVPAQTMIWSPELLGEFLDAVGDHEYHALFTLSAYRGLRRGELLGLRWSDIDFEQGYLRVERQLLSTEGKLYFSDPKSESGRRVVSLDSHTLQVLKDHRKAQAKARLKAGGVWEDLDLVFTDNHGQPIPPDRVTKTFKKLVRDLDLPPVRFHSLRHCAATIALAAGVSPKTVQDQLGHATVNITLNVYSHTVQEVAKEAADATASLIARHRRQKDA